MKRPLVLFKSPSGVIHAIKRRSAGGAGKFLCGRVGEGWTYTEQSGEPTCRQCKKHREE